MTDLAATTFDDWAATARMVPTGGLEVATRAQQAIGLAPRAPRIRKCGWRFEPRDHAQPGSRLFRCRHIDQHCAVWLE